MYLCAGPCQRHFTMHLSGLVRIRRTLVNAGRINFKASLSCQYFYRHHHEYINAILMVIGCSRRLASQWYSNLSSFSMTIYILYGPPRKTFFMGFKIVHQRSKRGPHVPLQLLKLAMIPWLQKPRKSQRTYKEPKEVDPQKRSTYTQPKILFHSLPGKNFMKDKRNF